MVWRTNITTLSAKSREPAWVLRFSPWRSQTVSDKQQVRQSLNWCSALAKVRPLASILNNIIMLWLLWTNWIFCVWKIKLVCSQSQYLYSPIKDINIDKDKNKVSIKKIKKTSEKWSHKSVFIILSMANTNSCVIVAAELLLSENNTICVIITFVFEAQMSLC